MIPIRHTDRDYETDLARLREQLLLMGACVEEMIAGALRALVERDSDLAVRMIEKDREVAIPDEILAKYLTPADLAAFKQSGAAVRSITVYGRKPA